MHDLPQWANLPFALQPDPPYRALADRITAWLREYLTQSGAAGFVVGLSGGVDSAVTAALCVQAVGREKVLGLLLPINSFTIGIPKIDDLLASFAAARWLGLVPLVWHLTSPYQEFARLYQEFVNDQAVCTTFNHKTQVNLGNLQARLRMCAQYLAANAAGYLVAGTSNRSEIACGYFSKWGDGAADLEPLGDLYKFQVYGLARELGVPEEIINRPPSAGLWPGQTDEGELGVTYHDLDRVLLAQDQGLPLPPDVTVETIQRIQELRDRSAHKRRPIPVCPIFAGLRQ